MFAPRFDQAPLILTTLIVRPKPLARDATQIGLQLPNPPDCSINERPGSGLECAYPEDDEPDAELDFTRNFPAEVAAKPNPGVHLGL